MKINVGDIILDIKKKPIQEGFTTGNAIINLLLSSYKDEESIPGTEKLKRYTIASAIESSLGIVELELDDLGLIKKYLDKSGANPMIYAAVYNALEGISKGDKPVDGDICSSS